MVPDTLHLRNFMCYGEDLPPLHFASLRVACLSGHNGAGKSALLDAITWALWGKARAKSDDDLITLGRDEMEVTLEFSIGAQCYRVVRRRKRVRRQGTTTLDFQIRNSDGSWRRLTGDTIAETQAAINAALRIEYDTFINSAFLVQGRADEFTSRKPAERKQVLADILGLAEYETLERRARDEANRLSKELDIALSHIARLQSEVELRPQFEQALADAQEQVATLQEEADDHESSLADLRERAMRLQEASDRRASLRAEIGRLETERASLLEQLATTRGNIERFETVIARRAEIEAGLADLQAARQRLVELESLREEHQRLLEDYRAWDDRLKELRHALERDLSAAQERLNTIYRRLERREDLLAERAGLTTRSEELRALQAEVARLRSEETRLSERYAESLDLQRRIAELQGVINVRRDSLIGAFEEQQRRVAALQAEIATLPDLEAQLRSTKRELLHVQSLEDELATRRDDVAVIAQRQGELQAIYNAVEAEGKELKEKLQLAERGDAACPVCGSELGADGLARLIAGYESQRMALRARILELRQEQRALESQMNDHRARMDELERLCAARGELEARRARLELQIGQARESQKALADASQTLVQLQQQLDQRDYAPEEQQALDVCVAQLGEWGDPRSIRAELQQTRAAIAIDERRLQEGEALRQQMARLDAELAGIDAAEAELSDAQARVAELERQLRDEAYGAEERQARDAVKQRGLELGYNRKEHESLRLELESLQHWEREARELERALDYIEREREQARRDQAQRERLDAELAARQREIGVLDEQLRDKPKIDATLREATLRGQQIQRRLAEAQSALGRAQSDLDRCARDAAELERQQQRAAELRDEHGIYEELAQAFGKKGVQAMLIETAIPELEHEANQLLARMTDNQFHLEFVTQREKKTGDSTIETLDIRISDGLGTRDYQMFSGGEAFRVNFAIRIALAKLLARRAGANLRTLIIDEGFGSQDNVGRDRIVEAINSIAGDFERILVITHIQELKEMFEAQIEIKKTPDGSIWSVV